MEYRVDKLRPGARYVLQIRSYNDEETSDWSPAFYVTIPSDTSIPANVGLVTATYTNQSFKFTWPAVTTNSNATPAYDIKNYQVTLSDGTNSYVATTSENEYIVTSDDFLSRLGVGSNVSISVIAVDLSGNESVTPSTGNVSAPTPSNVSGFTAAGSIGAIRLAWNRVTNVAIKEYEIYAGGSGFTADTAGYTNRIAVTNNDSFVWTSGSGDAETKYFKIRAISIHNVPSASFTDANTSTVDSVPTTLPNTIEPTFQYTGALPTSYIGTQRWYVNKAGTIESVRGSVSTPANASGIYFNIVKNGTTDVRTSDFSISSGSYTTGLVTTLLAGGGAVAAGDYLTVEIVSAAATDNDLTVQIRIIES